MDSAPNLLAKVIASVRRDTDLPVREKLGKAARYVAATVTGPFFLRDCDSVGARARTRGRPRIENLGSIEIGEDVQLNSSFSPVLLSTGPGGVLRIGDQVDMNFGTSVSANVRVEIGSRVAIGPYVTIADHVDAPSNGARPAPVLIGDDVWLAARVRVLPGAIIGAGTVVTAGSVVDRELPPGVIAGGAPARVLRDRNGAASESGAAAGASPSTTASRVPRPQPVTATAPCRGVLVADFTVDDLRTHLEVPDVLGPALAVDVAPFGQAVQTLHALAGAAGEASLDFALVWTRPEEAVRTFAARLAGEEVRDDEILEEVDAFASLLQRGASGVRFLFVASWVLPPYHRGFGIRDMKAGGIARTLHQMNLRLAERLEACPNAYVLDAGRWIAAAGRTAMSPKLWYAGKVAFSTTVLVEAAADVRAALRGVLGMAKKLVILDLDDTLWGGIVGEVGWQNLRLGGHDALGEAFVDFQRELKGLARRGIALGVVSKNEERVALEAMGNHPEMLIRPQDIAAHRINWQDKAMNVVELVKELNLGLQSAVFIDDNPVERARVREALPEVYVPDWPVDKTLYASTLLGLRCFDVPVLTREDAERAEMYAAERRRTELKTQLSSLDEWLLGLGIRVSIVPLGAANVSRTAQLLNKTNQMNLRTRRLSDAEQLDWSRSPAREVWAVSVSDRFGDAGLTGILGLEFSPDTATIIDYVLSCRVMGRKIEETMLAIAVDRARERGARVVEAPFFETAKNKPCFAFLSGSGLGFDERDRTFRWEAGRAVYPVPACVVIDRPLTSPPREAAHAG